MFASLGVSDDTTVLVLPDINNLIVPCTDGMYERGVFSGSSTRRCQ